MLHTRMLFDDGGGIGQPFIKGWDETGPFVGIFGLQDGLPDGCNIAGNRCSGIDRGIFIEIKACCGARLRRSTRPRASLTQRNAAIPPRRASVSTTAPPSPPPFRSE